MDGNATISQIYMKLKIKVFDYLAIDKHSCGQMICYIILIDLCHGPGCDIN